jgi:hypothetical protein
MTCFRLLNALALPSNSSHFPSVLTSAVLYVLYVSRWWDRKKMGFFLQKWNIILNLSYCRSHTFFLTSFIKKTPLVLVCLEGTLFPYPKHTRRSRSLFYTFTLFFVVGELWVLSKVPIYPTVQTVCINSSYHYNVLPSPWDVRVCVSTPIYVPWHPSSVRAQCLTILLFKHFALCGTITGSSYCSAKCKMLK